MGKNLKGKELGVGISQRKDGLYTARYTDKTGKRRQKYFKKLQECRNWIADARFEDEHGDPMHCENPTVDAWFQYWINEVKNNSLRYTTKRLYQNRYRINIKPIIGDICIKDIKPMHCHTVVNQMANIYADKTIEQTRLVMYSMFDYALDNGMIKKNPITKSVRSVTGRESKTRRALTSDEEKILLEILKGKAMYNQCAFILQTGLRIGELIGLKWSDVDFEKRIIHIRRTMTYINKVGWIIGDPKTKNSIRDIPLTQEAIDILKNQKEKLKKIKVIQMEYGDHVFLSRFGSPTQNDTYNNHLQKYCKRAGIDKISMHSLRHTFATRCAEGGMKPKTLQMILGHSNIGITMNIYVHLTEEEKFKEMNNIEKILKLM